MKTVPRRLLPRKQALVDPKRVGCGRLTIRSILFFIFDVTQNETMVMLPPCDRDSRRCLSESVLRNNLAVQYIQSKDSYEEAIKELKLALLLVKAWCQKEMQEVGCTEQDSPMEPQKLLIKQEEGYSPAMSTCRTRDEDALTPLQQIPWFSQDLSVAYPDFANGQNTGTSPSSVPKQSLNAEQNFAQDDRFFLADEPFYLPLEVVELLSNERYSIHPDDSGVHALVAATVIYNLALAFHLLAATTISTTAVSIELATNRITAKTDTVPDLFQFHVAPTNDSQSDEEQENRKLLFQKAAALYDASLQLAASIMVPSKELGEQGAVVMVSQAPWATYHLSAENNLAHCYEQLGQDAASNICLQALLDTAMTLFHGQDRDWAVAAASSSSQANDGRAALLLAESLLANATHLLIEDRGRNGVRSKNKRTRRRLQSRTLSPAA